MVARTKKRYRIPSTAVGGGLHVRRMRQASSRSLAPGEAGGLPRQRFPGLLPAIGKSEVPASSIFRAATAATGIDLPAMNFNGFSGKSPDAFLRRNQLDLFTRLNPAIHSTDGLIALHPACIVQGGDRQACRVIDAASMRIRLQRAIDAAVVVRNDMP